MDLNKKHNIGSACITALTLNCIQVNLVLLLTSFCRSSLLQKGKFLKINLPPSTKQLLLYLDVLQGVLDTTMLHKDSIQLPYSLWYRIANVLEPTAAPAQ